MKQIERVAFFLGGILLAVSAGIIFGEAGLARRSKRLPVEQLANQLKDAWADHHTRA